MKAWLRLSLVFCGLAIVSGCDWTFGGGVESYNSRWNWANFSGVYRGVDGGVAVTDFTATPGTPGTTNNVSNETIGTADGSGTRFNGVLRRKPILPGSVTISTASFQLQDNGDGTLSGSGKSGAIDYGTGAWSIDLGFDAPSAGTPIRASYQYTVSGTPGTGGPGSGATQVRINSFTVFQEGETLQITDNNGAVYTGNMGSMRGTGGFDGRGAPPAGETIVAQFTARGVAASGLEVELVGTFNAVIGGGGEGDFFLVQRGMFGTWIEAGGRTGDINAVAGPLQVFPDTAGGN